jgi:hypothetical protein
MMKDATAGLLKEMTDAAIDLIWLLLANKVITASEWAASLLH